MTPPDPSSSSLARHLESLYPVACVLASPDRADSLVEHAYQRAADVPPAQRPSDERAWLFRLLVKARTERPDGNAGPQPGADEPSPDDDTFRHTVAVETARRHLPVALAACSARQRFVLTLDVLDADDDTLAAALDRTVEEARSARDQARSALRASLRDVLNGPERMLVDVALPDEALRRLLRTLLEEQFLPLPSSLRRRVHQRLEAARAEGASNEKDDPEASPWSSWAAALRRHLNSRTSVLVGLVLVFVAGGLAGLAYFDAPSPSSPSQGIVAFSTRQAADLSPARDTDSATEAAAFIRRTWDRQVSVPSIERASLLGVGRRPLDGGAEVPALLYRDDENGTRIVAYVFNYALLDRIDDRIRLSTSLRDELAANDAPLTRRRGDRALVLWRQRDDIFVLVAPDTPPDTLRARIQL